MSQAGTAPTESCTCVECRSYCGQNPGFPTPQEAERLLDAGLGPRLMLDWWNAQEDGGHEINLLCPAIKTYEGHKAPDDPTGRCTFFTEDRLCEIHGPNKPSGCTLVRHGNDCDARRTIQAMIARQWDTDRGRVLVNRWQEHYAAPPTSAGRQPATDPT